jgi:hypothetical protein
MNLQSFWVETAPFSLAGPAIVFQNRDVADELQKCLRKFLLQTVVQKRKRSVNWRLSRSFPFATTLRLMVQDKKGNDRRS